MRYFRHHIGDYAAATAHLSFIEDAAYHRLLRRYYQDEKKLPCDVALVCRLVGAKTRDEKRAVEAILLEFFTLVEAGWQQVRADTEIELFQKKVQTARDNGKSGGRPKEKAVSNENKDLGNPEETHTQTERKPTEKLPTTHEPVKLPLDKSNGHSPPPPAKKVDLPSRIFGECLTWLAEKSSKPPDACRALLGKWRKSAGDAGLVEILGAAEAASPIDPVGWIQRAVIARQKPPDQQGWNL